MPRMLPLAGVVVVDLSKVLSGPFASQQLVDLGAEVWKIEHPRSGDDTRSFGPPFQGGESSYFLSVNRGKKSVAIDLKAPEGRALVLRMIDRADVALENFRPGAAERLGLGPEALHARKPSLVTLALRGYGSDGDPAYTGRGGYDAVIQAASGLMSLTGAVDGPPSRVGVAIADLLVGLYGVQGLLAALFRRERTGQGSHVEVSMQDAMGAILTYQAGSYFATGQNPPRLGDAHPSICPYESVDCADGRLMLAVGTDAQFERLAAVLGRPELAQDPRYRTNPDRVRNRDAVLAVLRPAFGADTVRGWEARLAAVGVPAGPILSVQEALEHPNLRARGSILEHTHPTAGRVRTIGSPVRLDGSLHREIAAPPRLGEHTREVLEGRLGLAAAEVNALEARGVVACLVASHR